MKTPTASKELTMRLDRSTCELRPLTPGDAPSLARHANDREIWLNLRDRFPHPYTLEDAVGYIAATVGRTPVTTFGIVVAGQACGTIGLQLHDDIERRNAELGYWLGRDHWGQGIVSDAVRAVTAYAFDALAMERVFAVPFVRNPASRRVLEKAGFVQEGRMRHSAIKDGVLLDQWLYAAYADRRPGAGAG
jgi:RimJ/RimL family protein N-acetyltransferase